MGDTLRGWVKQRRIDSSRQRETTTGNPVTIKDLQTEVCKQRLANESLLAAWTTFAQKHDPRLPW